MVKLMVAYAAVALLTFGFAASSTQSCKRRAFGGPLQSVDCRANVGLISGAVWPLYWSWSAFDAGRAALQEAE